MNLEIIKKYFEPTSILDIGANVGQFYNECRQIFPDAYYYLIEGNPNCAEYLKRLNVDYVIKALSDSEKQSYMFIRKNQSNMYW